MKIIDLIIDEDNNVEYNEYYDLNEYVDNVNDIISIFSESDIVNINEVYEYFKDEYEDENDVDNVMVLMNSLDIMKKLMKDNENYVLVEYSVEYDNSYLLIDKNDYIKLVNMGNV